MTEASPLLELSAIDKRFPGVHALEGISFDLRPGEVHALLGENGAGKSTLVKILSGVYRPDSGRLLVRGTHVGAITPEDARTLGIALVHQELSLVPALSVAENMFLGALPRTRVGTIDWRRARTEAHAALTRLGVDIDPARELRTLEVAEQQLVEIAKNLMRNPQILLLDEPTSALSDTERSRLFDVIRTLKARGVGIIYISHHLSEVAMIADRVTVLRDGRVVGTIPASEASQEVIIGMMVGRRLADQFPERDAELGDPALDVRKLSFRDRFSDISFSVRRGEIVGVFGVMGAGQAELARTLFGLERATAGSIAIHGRPQTFRSPRDAIRAGMGLISRDRRQSLVPMLPTGPNLSLAWLARRHPWQLLERQRERIAARKFITELNIEPPLPDRELMYFSGGNQQKVVLSRWMSAGADILIFDEPTRGIDVGAKAEVFALMNRLSKRGAAIVMISSEPPELAGMANRVIVLRNGTVVRELVGDEISHEALLHAAS